MTVKEYIVSSLPGVTVPESFFVDMPLDLDAEYDSSMFYAVGDAMVGALAGLILAPMVKSVNENGFSMSWDRGTLGKYYLWLCKRYGITPDPEVVALIGTSSVIDISDIW